MSSPSDERVRDIVVAFNDQIHEVARSEYRRLPSDLVDYNELVYIGTVAVHALVSSNPERELTYSYVATAVRWAIRNELKHRYDGCVAGMTFELLSYLSSSIIPLGNYHLETN
jgi:hypothetical protein